MSSDGIRILAAVVGAVCVVVVYVLAYFLVGDGGHGHIGLAAIAALTYPPGVTIWCRRKGRTAGWTGQT